MLAAIKWLLLAPMLLILYSVWFYVFGIICSLFYKAVRERDLVDAIGFPLAISMWLGWGLLWTNIWWDVLT